MCKGPKGQQCGWGQTGRLATCIDPPNPNSFSTWIAWIERRPCRKERPLVVNAAPSDLAVTPPPSTHSGQQNKSSLVLRGLSRQLFSQGHTPAYRYPSRSLENICGDFW